MAQGRLQILGPREFSSSWLASAVMRQWPSRAALWKRSASMNDMLSPFSPGDHQPVDIHPGEWRQIEEKRQSRQDESGTPRVKKTGTSLLWRHLSSRLSTNEVNDFKLNAGRVPFRLTEELRE
ncbi:hypothetical protein AVEN_146455-1 [Araneus ventricosus]|uniref:Uncharacterized protein n=1 Tax=Araneus ventricosus TaxID=182803 RepID=A0A4Y2NSG6_ARAVE|nr:hypothetical protein AVEN_146455-1 [Araneus ventricosus]